MQVFYVNIGGGEPTVRRDFWELVDYATAHHVGVKFSTNGSRITAERAARLAANDYVDVQVSLDGATAEVNDAIRGPGSYTTAITAMERLARPASRASSSRWSSPGENVGQLDAFKRLADRYGAQLRLTRLRPSGRGADVLGSPAPDRRAAARALRLAARPRRGRAHRRLLLPPQRRTATPLPGLNLCGAGRVVCLIDPLGDVYACPFAIHDEFRAGNVREPGGFARDLADARSCSRTCAGPSPRARAPAAACSTHAAAAAWRPSSSPGCRWTGPIPSACSGTASACWPARA